MIEKRGRNKTIVCDECNTNRTTCMQNLDSLLELAKQKGWKNSTHKYGDHTAHINICPQCQRGETKLIFTQSKAASKVLTQKTDKELDKLRKELKQALKEDDLKQWDYGKVVGVSYPTCQDFIKKDKRPRKETMAKIEKYLEGRHGRTNQNK